LLFSDPISKEFLRRDDDLISIFQRLSILSFRYDRNIVRATEVDWHEPFPTHFSFFEDVCRSGLQVLTTSITEDVAALFYHVSPADVCDHTTHLRHIGRHWSTLADEIAECAVADDGLVPRLLRIAEVRRYPVVQQ
jgi:hypothetical protein